MWRQEAIWRDVLATLSPGDRQRITKNATHGPLSCRSAASRLALRRCLALTHGGIRQHAPTLKLLTSMTALLPRRAPRRLPSSAKHHSASGKSVLLAILA